MHLRGWSIVGAGLALALAGCGSEAPTPAPGGEEQEMLPDLQPVMGPERTILAFGDSLFAGYRMEDRESYPARLEVALRAKGINARIANAGVSGDTTAAGLQRLKFVLDNQPKAPELVLLELGGNDLLRGLSPDETRANISAILGELKARKIPVVLMGMRAPPNLGTKFQGSFDALYADLAKEYGATLVPFFLEPVYDKPELLQDDKIHPNQMGIEELVAATSEKVSEALPQASSGKT